MGVTKQTMKDFTKRATFFVLLLLIVWRPLMIIYSQRDLFFSKGYAKQYSQLKNAYYSSQYVKKDKPGIMPDESFESFVGGAFLKGLNPILIVHEHPPMGRYIIALSIYLFDNAKTVTLFCMAISTVGLFLISKQILKKTLYAFFPLAIFVNEPLFINKFFYAPLLEPIQQPFIVFALYFFIRGILSKNCFKWFVAASLMLGFVISIRFFILGTVMLAGMITILLIEKKSKKLLLFIASLPLALGVLFASYTKTIQDGYSLLDILKVQKYIFFYHKSQLVSPISFWDLLLFNRWHTWWADKIITSDIHWIIFWPISTIGVFTYLFLVLTRKMKLSKEEKVIMLWIIVYIVLLSVGNTTTRYFFPLLPFLYILVISFIKKIIFKKR